MCMMQLRWRARCCRASSSTTTSPLLSVSSTCVSPNVCNALSASLSPLFRSLLIRNRLPADGFHKVVGVDGGSISSNSDQTWEFVHPCVVRGRPDLLIHVKRKVRTGNTSVGPSRLHITRDREDKENKGTKRFSRLPVGPSHLHPMRASNFQQIPGGISKRFASSEDVSSVVNDLNSLRGQQSLVSSKFEDMQRSVHRQRRRRVNAAPGHRPPLF